MRTLRPMFKLLVSLTAVGLLVAACGSPTPTATNPIVVPTKAPTVAATHAPTVAPTQAAKPTAQASAAPTHKPAAQPTTKPVAQPTAKATAIPAPEVMAFGTSATVGDLAITPSEAERLMKSGANVPKQGDIFVIISLTVSNATKTATAKFDPISLALSTGPDAKQILPMELASITDSLKAQDIKADGKIDGRVAFEVPQSALSLLLMFTGANAQHEIWKVPDPTLGTALQVGSLALTPMTFERLATSGSDTPKAGDEYLILTVNVQNVGTTDTIHFDPTSLLLMASCETKSLTPVSLASLKDQITAQDLKPGASLQGVVAFEVPKADINLEVTYQYKDNQTARWALTG